MSAPSEEGSNSSSSSSTVKLDPFCSCPLRSFRFPQHIKLALFCQFFPSIHPSRWNVKPCRPFWYWPNKCLSSSSPHPHWCDGPHRPCRLGFAFYRGRTFKLSPTVHPPIGSYRRYFRAHFRYGGAILYRVVTRDPPHAAPFQNRVALGELSPKWEKKQNLWTHTHTRAGTIGPTK